MLESCHAHPSAIGCSSDTSSSCLDVSASDASLPFSADVSAADRAGSNRVCEDGLYADAPAFVKRLRLPCVAHMASTSTGRGLSTVSREFTGLIATALAMDPAGMVKELRGCIEEVLLESLLPVVDGPRLPDGHESVQYLRALLHLCLPPTEGGSQRCCFLLSLLTSDVREPYIQLRVPGGAANICTKTWARNVSHALLPRSIGVFARHRWCNSLPTVQPFVLIANIHDLLYRAGVRWLRHGAVAGLKPPSHPQVERNPWLDSVDVDELGGAIKPSSSTWTLLLSLWFRRHKWIGQLSTANKKARPLRGSSLIRLMSSPSS